MTVPQSSPRDWQIANQQGFFIRVWELQAFEHRAFLMVAGVCVGISESLAVCLCVLSRSVLNESAAPISGCRDGGRVPGTYCWEEDVVCILCFMGIQDNASRREHTQSYVIDHEGYRESRNSRGQRHRSVPQLSDGIYVCYCTPRHAHPYPISSQCAHSGPDHPNTLIV